MGVDTGADGAAARDAADAVAVAVVAVAGDGGAVFFDETEATGGVVDVVVGRGDAVQGFDLLRDAAEFVAGVVRAV